MNCNSVLKSGLKNKLCHENYEESYSQTFKDTIYSNKILPLESKYNFRVTSSDWVVGYQKQGTVGSVEKTNVFGLYMDELTNITEEGLPVNSSCQFTNVSRNEEIPTQKCIPTTTTHVRPLKKIRGDRISSSNWSRDYVIDEFNIDISMTDIFSERSEESDQDNDISEDILNGAYRSNLLIDLDSSFNPKPTIGGNVFINEYNDRDVLFGRGGKGNHHPGNKEYRRLVRSYKREYKNTSCKQAKTALAKFIMEKIEIDGGRFLRYNKKEEEWIEVPRVRARTKVSQALRESKD